MGKSISSLGGSSEPVNKKLVVVGDGGCGKTCLLFVFRENKFPDFYVPTIFDTSVADIQVGNLHVKLTLWDTAGQDSYDRLRPLSYPDTDVVLMCFSLDDTNSFENVGSKWNPEIKHFCPGVPVILVGTKMDLLLDGAEAQQQNHKQVTAEEGRQLTEGIKAYAYVECSAKSREGVQKVFTTATVASLEKTKTINKYCRLL